MIRNILFAADLGVYTPYMLQHVLGLAEQYRAQVTVLHAVEPMSLFANAVVKQYMPELTRRELEHGGVDRILMGIRSRILAALADEIIDGSQGLVFVNDVRVVCGRPADVILTEAAHHGADLIVMGRSGGHSPGSAWVGSVAGRVLQLARVPVYLVPMASSPASNDGAELVHMVRAARR